MELRTTTPCAIGARDNATPPDKGELLQGIAHPHLRPAGSSLARPLIGTLKPLLGCDHEFVEHFDHRLRFRWGDVELCGWCWGASRLLANSPIDEIDTGAAGEKPQL